MQQLPQYGLQGLQPQQFDFKGQQPQQFDFQGKEKGRDLTQSYDKSPYTDSNIKKATWKHKKTPPNTSITQRLRTDLGWSVGVTIATQLVWLNRLTRDPNLPAYRKTRVIKMTHIKKFVNNPSYEGRGPTANWSGKAINIIKQICKVIKQYIKNI